MFTPCTATMRDVNELSKSAMTVWRPEIDVFSWSVTKSFKGSMSLVNVWNTTVCYIEWHP